MHHYLGPGARFLKAPETFRARKAIFSPFVSKNGEAYTPETSLYEGNFSSYLECVNKTAL